MTRPQLDTLPDTLESLDLEFEPQCTWGTSPLYGDLQCQDAAAWTFHRATALCCDRPTVVLDCDKHACVIIGWVAINRWVHCGYCGTPNASRDIYLSWTRL